MSAREWCLQFASAVLERLVLKSSKKESRGIKKKKSNPNNNKTPQGEKNNFWILKNEWFSRPFIFQRMKLWRGSRKELVYFQQHKDSSGLKIREKWENTGGEKGGRENGRWGGGVGLEQVKTGTLQGWRLGKLLRKGEILSKKQQ